MTLIICGDCRKEYSSYAISCPKCARPTSTQVIKNNQRVLAIIPLFDPNKLEEMDKSWDYENDKVRPDDWPGNFMRQDSCGGFQWNARKGKWVKWS